MTDEATNPVADEDVRAEGDVLAGEGVDQTEIDQTDEAEGAADSEQPEQTEEPEEEYEEVERGGRKYRIPKALAPELLMQADYTRKTQALAEERRAFEAERLRQREADEAFDNARLAVQLIDRRLAQFEKLDWDAVEARDRQQGTNEATRLFREYQLLKGEREKAVAQVTAVEQERILAAQQAFAKQREEMVRVLEADIQFNAELDKQITEFALKECGLTEEELCQIVDPRVVKVLHRAMLGDQALKAQRQAKKIAQRQKTAPAQTLRGASGRFAPPPDTDDFSAFEKAYVRS